MNHTEQPHEFADYGADVPLDFLPLAGSQVRSLRVWPAIILVVALWGFRLIPPTIEEPSMATMMAMFMGPLVCAGLVLLWWLFFSRATVLEKILGFVAIVVIFFGCNAIADKTVKGFGMMMNALPWGITAFVAALVVHRLAKTPRRLTVALAAALIGFGFWTLVRTDEIRGDFEMSRTWRWEPSPEDLTLQELAARETSDAEADPPALGISTWPAFRGDLRDGVQPGIILAEDWQANAPQEIWRVPVGPGWSSFSVAGDRLFTQEQRGENEVVVCYDARNGNEVWKNEVASRFWEVVGGAGPRATPTLSDGQLYALGANGILQRLDPETGIAAWKRDLRKDADRKPPQWGYSASPLVTHGVVVVHAGGAGDKGILAYDAETGEPRWGAAAGGHSYSSSQLAEVFGEPRILTLTDQELSIIDPVDGRLVGEHVWVFEGYRVVQPLLIGGTSVLMGSPMGTGTRRVELSQDGDEIATEEGWTSKRMNPYYNDYVAHQGYLYGIDHNIFACLDLQSGKRQWKKGRYGNGQVLLLPDNDQLLILSEDGEIVLLRANPEEHQELTRFRVLEGRTWNHPVMVGNRLYVRNSEEAACFEMPTQNEPGPIGDESRPVQ